MAPNQAAIRAGSAPSLPLRARSQLGNKTDRRRTPAVRLMEGMTMEMTGEYRIPADRATVWQALNDPEILKTSIPGCEELFRNEDGTLSAKVVAKVGPVKATFAGDVAFSNVIENESYTISGEGKGGVAGFAKGSADVRLADIEEGTLLTYAVKAQVGGKLAQVGSRLIDSSARKMADEFFGAFSARLSGEDTLATSPPLAGLSDEEAAQDELIDRLEHRVDDRAEDLGEAAEEIEEEIEVAAGRGFLGGPYVWGLIALLILIVALAVLH